MHQLSLDVKENNGILKDIKRQTKRLSPISHVTKTQQCSIEKRLDKNFKEVSSFNVVVDTKKQPFEPKGLKSKDNFLDNWGILDNKDIVDTFKILDNHIPDNLKQMLLTSGIDLKQIVEQSLRIPEHTKAIRNCDTVINKLQKDPCIPTIELQEKGKEIHRTDEKMLKTLKRNLEDYLINTKESAIPLNNEVKKKMSDLEKIYQYSLAENFKKVNVHNLKKDLSEIGINSIKVTGDSLYIFMNNEIGRVLKVTASVGSFVVKLYDNVWRSNNFKPDTPENDDLTPLDLLNSKKAIERRDNLVKRNTGILMTMIKYIDDRRTLRPEKSETVSALLKGFGCSDHLIKQNIANKDFISETINERMRKLYTL